MSDIEIPVLRNDGVTLEDRMSENAYNDILPARYLKKDENGNIIEEQEELFERVAKNIAVAEAVHSDDALKHVDVECIHSHFDEDDIDGYGFDFGTIPLTEETARYFSYDKLMDEFTDFPEEYKDTIERMQKWKKKFQHHMENLKIMANTPCLINAGSELQMLSACFVLEPDDDMQDIHNTANDASRVFKMGGGLGYPFSTLRPYGDVVGSTGGVSSGPLSFMQTFDTVCSTVSQGGIRRGAQMGVMHSSHPDIPFFIHAKNTDVSLAKTLLLNDPDDPTHTSFGDAIKEARELIDEEGRVPEHLRNAAEGHLSNFNISVTVDDEFMDSLRNGKDYTMINPRTEEPHIATEHTKELYSWFDMDEYVEVGEVLSVPAEELWDRMIQGAYENGEPGVIYIDRVNENNTFDIEENPEHIINATNPCLTGDSRVYTEDGMIKFEELYQNQSDVLIDSVFDEGGVGKTRQVFQNGKKNVYKVITKEGYSLKGTSQHEIKTFGDGFRAWTEISDLESGDEIKISEVSEAFGKKGSIEEGRVMGWFAGDGHYNESIDRAILNFYDQDINIVDEMVKNVNKVVPDSDINREYPIGAVDIDESAPHRDDKDKKTISSERLYDYFKREIGEDKTNVPERVYKGSEKMVRGYLQGIFSADGSVQSYDGQRNSIRLTSIDSEYLEEIQQILLQFGIKSSIYNGRKEEGITEMPNGKGGESEYKCQELHELIISKDGMVKFNEEIGFILQERQEQLNEMLEGYTKGPYSQNFYATVESVEFVGEEMVYDLSEMKTNSYVADGITVHNCGEEPLEDGDACNLNHINLSTIVNEDIVPYSEYGGDYDTYSDGEVEQFLDQAIDWEEFNERIEVGTRFLDNVVTMSDFPVDKIDTVVQEQRKIGLGIMGLAQLFIQLGVEYGSEESNEIARQIMKHIHHESKRVSKELAETRGNFEKYDESKWNNPTKFPDFFERHTGLNPEEWENGYPQRNHETTTIAPTGCVEENTIVSSESGLKKIKKLSNGDEKSTWEAIDTSVVTDEGVEESPYMYHNGYSEVKDIETERGFSVSATPEHKFRTIDKNGDYVWKEAEEFKEGDNILMKRGGFEESSEPTLDVSERDNFYHNTNEDLTLPEEMSPKLSEFLGYYMGDGYVHEGSCVKLITETENREIREKLTQLSEDVFGVKPTFNKKGSVTNLRVGGRHLPRYFNDNGWRKEKGNGGEGSASAFVPEEVRTGSKKTLRAFMKGLFEADGCISRKVELSTVSEKLANQVQNCLLSLGHIFTQNNLNPEELGKEHYGERTQYRLRGINKYEDKKFCKDIGFITKEYNIELSSKSYMGDVYPPSIYKTIRNQEGYGGNVDKNLRRRVNAGSSENQNISLRTIKLVSEQIDDSIEISGRDITDFYCATIKSVTDGMAETKDISVPSNNTYIANGFVTHNTTSRIANTTGGCEPIYNVAFFKNVTDDIQGEEMMVVFDSLFIKTLEENDIDVEQVKKEAQELMNNNEFEGAESLSTVPDEIANLFVTTGDLNAKEHASVQCALQEGVGSGISKTTNAPSDATLEDAKETFEYIYENGGKSVTFYRDGTRTKQVNTTRKDNQEVEGESDSDGNEFSTVEPRDRPKQTEGETQKIDSPYGTLYVTINEDEYGPVEMFATVGKSGANMESFTEALARQVSLSLRAGVDIDEIIDQMENIRSPEIAWDEGETIHSIPDGIATALKRYRNEESEESNDNMNHTTVVPENYERDSTGKECPDCGGDVIMNEGCEKCEDPSCGWSKC